MLAQCTHTHMYLYVSNPGIIFHFWLASSYQQKKNSGIVPNSPPAPQLIDFPKPWQQAMIPKNRRRRRHTFSQSAVFHQKPSILPQTTKTHPFFREDERSLSHSLSFSRALVLSSLSLAGLFALSLQTVTASNFSADVLSELASMVGKVINTLKCGRAGVASTAVSLLVPVSLWPTAISSLGVSVQRGEELHLINN